MRIAGDPQVVRDVAAAKTSTPSLRRGAAPWRAYGRPGMIVINAQLEDGMSAAGYIRRKTVQAP